jgi:malonyl-CoA/methylmalonyl-CoA synthetase
MAEENIVSVLFSRRDPTSVAFRLPDKRSYISEELQQRASRAAAVLRRLGVRAGDRVAFRLEKSVDVVILVHACFRLGAVIHPLNVSYADEETGALLRDSTPRLFVCEASEQERLSPIAKAAGARIVSFKNSIEKRLNADEVVSEIADVSSNSAAAILYTSGTTGRPKGALITHGNLSHSARALTKVWNIGPTDCVLHCLPLYHAHGLFVAINPVLYAGASILLLPRFAATDVVEALPNATILMGVPTHYSRLLREPNLKEALRKQVRLAISGSAPLSLEISRDFEDVTGKQIIERYGATETTIVTATPDNERCQRRGWVGFSLPDVEIRVASEDGQSRIGAGMLETRGPNVFAGYLNRPADTREAFTADGWFVTGDIAEIDADRCVRILGRSKDLIISGGLNVYPKEVEMVVDNVPGVAESAVFGVAHPDFGEAVVAAVVVKKGTTFNESAIIEATKAHLAGYKIPKRVFEVPKIRRSDMGKVLKNELCNLFKNIFAAS